GFRVPAGHIPVPDTVEVVATAGVARRGRDAQGYFPSGAELHQEPRRPSGHGGRYDEELTRGRRSGRRLEHRRSGCGPVGRVVARHVETPHVALQVPGIDVIGYLIAIEIR